jgi:hypothetical protein
VRSAYRKSDMGRSSRYRAGFFFDDIEDA